jgi:hypothetical protein
MISKAERLLFLKELGRLNAELQKCNDDQVRDGIHQDIHLLLEALSLTAIN